MWLEYSNNGSSKYMSIKSLVGTVLMPAVIAGWDEFIR